MSATQQQQQIQHLRTIASFLIPNENDQEVLLKRLQQQQQQDFTTAPRSHIVKNNNINNLQHQQITVSARTVASFLLPNDRDQEALYNKMVNVGRDHVEQMVDARTTSTDTEDAIRRKYGSHGARSLSSQELNVNASTLLEGFLAKL